MRDSSTNGSETHLYDLKYNGNFEFTKISLSSETPDILLPTKLFPNIASLKKLSHTYLPLPPALLLIPVLLVKHSITNW